MAILRTKVNRFTFAKASFGEGPSTTPTLTDQERLQQPANRNAGVLPKTPRKPEKLMP
jgi:hypothetical protein